MIAEIISTGDEVLTGTVVDANAAWIAGRLYETGIAVGRHVCVGDDMERLTDVLAETGQRADIAVVTGGLGPTVDDITASAAARAAGVELERNNEAMAYMEAFFKRFDRPVSDSDAKQALLPQGATPLLNSVGTAPGFTLKMGGCRFFFLPGVPFEMRQMMADHVIASLEADAARKGTGSFYREKRLSLFGLPEAHVNERLADLTGSLDGVKLGMLAEFPVIHVKLAASGTDCSALEAAVSAAADRVRERVGDYVFSETGQRMEEVVGDLLSRQSATLALAESCTGGMIASRITNVAGSSRYFLCSVVTYSNDAKMRMLGVSAHTLETCGAVCEQTAREMAEGASRMANADYAVSVTGIAGPGGGTAEKPVGTVCIGLCGPEQSFARKYKFPFENRMANKRIFAETAFNLLRKTLNT
ncbi:nicotinamide-nucleotide amidase [Desulfosalsimonas propionicica]|uniref:CinA-like protein n=1 Tax=Desulfosalsimonas propionicica TaxID=332175 RepID=A0A7W0C894_9BACT|nr:competence/damage-inducible protein A [Desulfosalsimonas propionicica]MBA2880884.1 nicotinamide-nucleotide amidase [Desulfosalsimonas propionicica]